MRSRVPMCSNGGDLSVVLTDRFQIVPQGISAELIAQEWGITREELDAVSLESHRRAIAAIDAGTFEQEIVPIELPEAPEPAPVGEGPAADGTPGAQAATAVAVAARVF